MKNKVFEIVISVVLAIVIVLQIITMIAVFGNGKSDEAPKEEGSALSMLNIDTPYCTMKYPSDWIEYLKIETPEVSEGYVATFVCEMNDKKAELFTVQFGAVEEQNVVGTINKSDIPVKIGLKTAELDRSLWTKEELEIVLEMQKAKEKVVDSILEQKDIP